jgi:hypothetical protein
MFKKKCILHYIIVVKNHRWLVGTRVNIGTPIICNRGYNIKPLKQILHIFFLFLFINIDPVKLL